MLNAVTLAAIVAAVWAHPQGVAYLDKIEQMRVCAEANGNPCCGSSGSGGGGGGGWIEREPVSREYLRALYEYEELDRRQLDAKPATKRKAVPLTVSGSDKTDFVKPAESTYGNLNQREDDEIVLAIAALFVLE